MQTLQLTNSYAALPAAFYTRLQPTGLSAPYLVAASAGAAQALGLDPAQFAEPDQLGVLAANRLPPGSEPLAAVYSGHQFGIWAGQLGDGRAILLGAAATGDGPVELQWKGSGRTPYSRMGDGRAVLRSSIREFLCSEAMHALGIPTTRALSVAGSDQGVVRESMETAAIVIRLAPSFVRFGSFEHWFYRNEHEHLRTLADYVIAQFYPELAGSPNPYAALLSEVTRRTAHLVAHWQAVGFMHGVLNTDNMSILGLTLDYGPFGFMEAFDSQHICNHTDQGGRYAYANQPQVCHWNCNALGQALLSLIGSVEETEQALSGFQEAFADKLDALLRAKLGLTTREDDDAGLVNALFAMLQHNGPDYTRFFRQLGNLSSGGPDGDAALRDMFLYREEWDAWAERYRSRLRREGSVDAARKRAMDAVNPKYVLRNYLAQVAIEKAQQKDFSEVRRLLTVLERPFDEQPEHDRYADLPPDWAAHLEVSCSS